MNSDGKTISKDPKLRAICKKEKAIDEQCKGKKCGEPCLLPPFEAYCDDNQQCDLVANLPDCKKEPELRNCLGYLDKQLPEQCQISKSEEKKCHEWLRKIRIPFKRC